MREHGATRLTGNEPGIQGKLQMGLETLEILEAHGDHREVCCNVNKVKCGGSEVIRSCQPMFR